MATNETPNESALIQISKNKIWRIQYQKDFPSYRDFAEELGRLYNLTKKENMSAEEWIKAEWSDYISKNRESVLFLEFVKDKYQLKEEPVSEKGAKGITKTEVKETNSVFTTKNIVIGIVIVGVLVGGYALYKSGKLSFLTKKA